MTKFNITKELSTEIKGVAILLMLIHHFFTFPQWYVKDYSFDISLFAKLMREPTKICVSIFAFLTGWVLSTKGQHIKSVFHKIIKFLVAYWIVYIPLLMLAILCGFNVNAKQIILESFGLYVPIMVFCWYVYFYIISLLAITCTRRLLNSHIITAIFVGIVIPAGFCLICKELCSNNEILNGMFYHIGQWYPCISIGYITNRYQLFTKINYMVKNKRLRILFAILAIFVAMFARNIMDKLDFIYGALAVWGLCEILTALDQNVRYFLDKMGGAINVYLVLALRILFGKTGEYNSTCNVLV